MSSKDTFVPRVNDRVLVLYGPRLYEAKIIDHRSANSNSEYSFSEDSFLVHYIKWNKTWDEWVPLDRILEFNSENLEKKHHLDFALKSVEERFNGVDSNSKSVPSRLSDPLKNVSYPSKFDEKEDFQCGICLDCADYRGALDCCDHFFCFNCIDEWCLITNTCPLCKKRFRFISRIPLVHITSNSNLNSNLISYDLGMRNDWNSNGSHLNSDSNPSQSQRSNSNQNSILNSLANLNSNSNSKIFSNHFAEPSAYIIDDRDQNGVHYDDEALPFYFPSYYIDENAVNCLKDDCLIKKELIVSENDITVACDSCDEWFHAECVNFDSEKNSHSFWHCPFCIQNSNSNFIENSNLNLIENENDFTIEHNDDDDDEEEEEEVEKEEEEEDNGDGHGGGDDGHGDDGHGDYDGDGDDGYIRNEKDINININNKMNNNINDNVNSSIMNANRSHGFHGDGFDDDDDDDKKENKIIYENNYAEMNDSCVCLMNVDDCDEKIMNDVNEHDDGNDYDGLGKDIIHNININDNKHENHSHNSNDKNTIEKVNENNNNQVGIDLNYDKGRDIINSNDNNDNNDNDSNEVDDKNGMDSDINDGKNSIDNDDKNDYNDNNDNNNNNNEDDDENDTYFNISNFHNDDDGDDGSYNNENEVNKKKMNIKNKKLNKNIMKFKKEDEKGCKDGNEHGLKEKNGGKMEKRKMKMDMNEQNSKKVKGDEIFEQKKKYFHSKKFSSTEVETKKKISEKIHSNSNSNSKKFENFEQQKNNFSKSKNKNSGIRFCQLMQNQSRNQSQSQTKSNFRSSVLSCNLILDEMEKENFDVEEERVKEEEEDKKKEEETNENIEEKKMEEKFFRAYQSAVWRLKNKNKNNNDYSDNNEDNDKDDKVTKRNNNSETDTLKIQKLENLKSEKNFKKNLIQLNEKILETENLGQNKISETEKFAQKKIFEAKNIVQKNVFEAKTFGQKTIFETKNFGQKRIFESVREKLSKKLRAGKNLYDWQISFWKKDVELQKRQKLNLQKRQNANSVRNEQEESKQIPAKLNIVQDSTLPKNLDSFVKVSKNVDRVVSGGEECGGTLKFGGERPNNSENLKLKGEKGLFFEKKEEKKEKIMDKKFFFEKNEEIVVQKEKAQDLLSRILERKKLLNESLSSKKQNFENLKVDNTPEFSFLIQLPDDMRPEITLNLKSNIPTSCRQKQLNRLVDHRLRESKISEIGKNFECEKIVGECIEIEKNIFFQSLGTRSYLKKFSRQFLKNGKNDVEDNTNHANNNVNDNNTNNNNNNSNSNNNDNNNDSNNDINNNNNNNGDGNGQICNSEDNSGQICKLPQTERNERKEKVKVSLEDKVLTALTLTGLISDSPHSSPIRMERNGENEEEHGGDEEEEEEKDDKDGVSKEKEEKDDKDGVSKEKEGKDDKDCVSKEKEGKDDKDGVRKEKEAKDDSVKRSGMEIHVELNDESDGKRSGASEKRKRESNLNLNLNLNSNLVGKANTKMESNGEEEREKVESRGKGERGEGKEAEGEVEGKEKENEDEEEEERMNKRIKKDEKDDKDENGKNLIDRKEKRNATCFYSPPPLECNDVVAVKKKRVEKEKEKEKDGNCLEKKSKGDSKHVHILMKQVKRFVHCCMEPYFRSGVISSEQLCTIVGKTSAKVMQHHSEETNADFLVAKGDGVQKLAHKYLKAIKQETTTATTTTSTSTNTTRL